MNRKKQIVTLGQRRADALKELCKEDNIIWRESYYGGRRFCFKISKEWAEKYPDLVSTKDENFESVFSNDAVSTLYFRILGQSIIDKNTSYEIGLNENHIRLLRRTYFDYEEINQKLLEDESDVVKNEIGDSFGLLYLGYKRPFGNSNVIGDILEEFDISTVDENGDYLDKDWDEEYGHLLEDSVQKIKDFFIHHPFDGSIQVEYESYSFKPTDKYLRKEKIEKLLNE